MNNMRLVLFAAIAACALYFAHGGANAATCGVCNDSYLSCLSNSSEASCKRSRESCMSACMSSPQDSATNSNGPGLFGIIFGVAIVLIIAYFAKEFWREQTAIPILDSRSPHREEVQRIVDDALARVEASQCSASEKSIRRDKLLGWVPLLKTNNNWTIKSLHENLDRFITGGLIPAEPASNRTRSHEKQKVSRANRNTRKRTRPHSADANAPDSEGQ